ncbi:MAG: TolC family protein [Candidatus Cryptobacteroides sp.]|nr:TolC family protein [Candidatus Cryptobacteroides sp.]
MRPGSRIRNVIAASVMMLFVTYYVNATDALQSAMAAKAAVLQSEKALEAAELQIRSEVVMAYESYQTAENILDTYASSISEDAKTILENRVFGYKSGDSRLFELLEAQRAYDEVLISFMEAQRDVFVSYAELCRAMGL